jgi:hypothetical protein
MNSIYRDIHKKALEIASTFSPPAFYTDFHENYEASKIFFETNPVILKLKAYVTNHIDNDFGHGMNHVVKVTIDAGTIIIIESKIAGYTEDEINRLMLIVQCAGLLHDIKRKKKDHAVRGSEFAQELLKSYPLTEDEIEDIRLSIKNHEAFKIQEIVGTLKGALLSDCLYDADKFRWGPDNFVETVWDMLEFSGTPINRFIEHYPISVTGLARIKETFRTKTGKKYGPQFIDLGIAIGQVIYEYLKKTYS